MANGQGTTTTTSEDLRGFTPRACWKLLVAMEAGVDKPPNRLTTMHAPTIPPDNMSFLPQKHDFAEEFDHLPFVGKEKIPKFHHNGHPVMKDRQPVWTEQPNIKGGPKAEFVHENGLSVDSTPKIGSILSSPCMMEEVASQKERRQDASLTSGPCTPTRRSFKWELGHRVDVIRHSYPSATKKLNNS